MEKDDLQELEALDDLSSENENVGYDDMDELSEACSDEAKQLVKMWEGLSDFDQSEVLEVLYSRLYGMDVEEAFREEAEEYLNDELKYYKRENQELKKMLHDIDEAQDPSEKSLSWHLLLAVWYRLSPSAIVKYIPDFLGNLIESALGNEFDVDHDIETMNGVLHGGEDYWKQFTEKPPKKDKDLN